MSETTSRGEAIAAFIKSEILPKIREDGGDIGFDRLEGGVVHLYMGAACATCPSRERTARHYVQVLLRRRFGDELRVQVRVQKPYFVS
jgi:Fe-S cluster biogenesis protein NfuA